MAWYGRKAAIFSLSKDKLSAKTTEFQGMWEQLTGGILTLSACDGPRDCQSHPGMLGYLL